MYEKRFINIKREKVRINFVLLYRNWRFWCEFMVLFIYSMVIRKDM